MFDRQITCALFIRNLESSTMLKDDNRKVMLEKVMKEHQYQESALLEILHKAQELYGFLDKNLMAYIANALNLPPSHVVGVATFYSYFKLKAPGEHVVTGCLGTACYVKAVDEIMTAIEHDFNLKRGGSTPDGRLSLFITRCIGACAMAPNIIVDDEVIGKATKEVVLERVRLALEGGHRR
jgi:bidirectional [NiFe] hydrogenase diaphorase subunit